MHGKQRLLVDDPLKNPIGEGQSHAAWLLRFSVGVECPAIEPVEAGSVLVVPIASWSVRDVPALLRVVDRHRHLASGRVERRGIAQLPRQDVAGLRIEFRVAARPGDAAIVDAAIDAHDPMHADDPNPIQAPRRGRQFARFLVADQPLVLPTLAIAATAAAV